MCPYEETSRRLPQGKMRWDLFCRIIDELALFPDLKLVVLMLQNEPLMGKNIFKEISYVKNKNPDWIISLTTNGSLLTEKVPKLLKDAGLDRIVFSLNGLTEKSFNEIQKKLDFNRTLKNLEALAQNKPSGLEVVVKCMMIKENLVEFMLPEKFSHLPKTLKRANIPIDIGPISNRAGALGNYEEILVYDHLQGSKRKLVCDDMFNSINILFNGEVISCCADWNRESVIGNLQKKSVREDLESREAQRRREMIQKGLYAKLAPCSSCSQAMNILKNIAVKT